MNNKTQAEPMVCWMDYPIGAKMTFDGDHLLEVVVIQDQWKRCSGCFFNHNTDGSCQGVNCMPTDRADGIDVIYKKIDL